jgi:signal transduction histidine kinase
LGALVVVLVAAQAVFVHVLARELSYQAGDVALAVGRDVVSVFAVDGSVAAPPTPHAVGTGERHEVVVIANGERLPAAGATAGAGSPAATTEVAPPPAGQYTYRVATYEVRDGEVGAPRHEVRLGSPAAGAGGDGQLRTTTRVVRAVATGAPLPSPQELRLILERAGHDAPDGDDVLTLVAPGLEKTIAIPRHGIAAAIDRFQTRLLGGALLVLAGGVLLAGLLAHRVTSPLRELGAAARQMAAGALGVQVAVAPGGEVGATIAAFNRMSADLAALDAEARTMRERAHLAELGEVARGLAHTLRNPLHGLGLAVDELAAGATPGDEAATTAAAARAQIGRLDRAIRALLALAGNGGSASEEVVDVGGLVQGVALEALQDARGRVAVEVEIAAAEACTLRGVAAELRAIVQALIVNAVEASPDGAAVRVRLAPGTAGGVALTVADEGCGLPPQVRARLFAPHVTTKPAGSGMGLFLAHRLATSRYAGTLALAEGRPAGTTATLTLADRQPGPAMGGAA